MGLSFWSSFLLSTTQMFGVGPLPNTPSNDWQVVQNFQIDGTEHPVLEMKSQEIAKLCNENPASFIKFPVLLYGAHEIYADGLLLERFGDPSFKKANFVLNAPVLECHFLKGKSEIVWKATAYTPYFARIKNYPQVVDKEPWQDFFGSLIFVGGFFAILSLGLI
jgi:hypothetical protein